MNKKTKYYQYGGIFAEWVTGIEPALSAWEAGNKLGSVTSTGHLDQEK
jgi:hypothetical protein